MKRIITLLLLTVLTVSTTSAQYYVPKSPYKWILSASWNAVEDNGDLFTNALDFNNSWNYKFFPTQISFTKNIKKKRNWDIQATYNNYDLGKRINKYDTLKGTFFALDANYLLSFGKHDLRRGKLAHFDPFVFGGVGYTMRTALSESSTFSLNGGVGFNYFITKRLGVQIRATAKYGIGDSAFSLDRNYTMYSIGLAYRHLPKGFKTNVNHKKRYKWTKKKPKYKRKKGKK